MVAYDFSVIKTTVSDTEKDRIMAVFFNTDNGVVSLSLLCHHMHDH